MEERHLKWLQGHPISVNLISGIVGFCGGFLMLAIVYNWFVDRDKVNHLAEPLLREWSAKVREFLSISTTLDGSEYPILIQTIIRDIDNFVADTMSKHTAFEQKMTLRASLRAFEAALKDLSASGTDNGKLVAEVNRRLVALNFEMRQMIRTSMRYKVRRDQWYSHYGE
jgi:hypothetical protein